MKGNVIKSIALAGVLALGLSGCSLLAPVATDHPYDPSDGVGADVAQVKVRNLLLLEGVEELGHMVVFTAVNNTEKPQNLNITFEDGAGVIQNMKFEVKPGVNKYVPDSDIIHSGMPGLIKLKKSPAGSTVKTYLQSGKSKEVSLHVPVLDNTLEEYKKLAKYYISEEAEK